MAGVVNANAAQSSLLPDSDPEGVEPCRGEVLGKYPHVALMAGETREHLHRLRSEPQGSRPGLGVLEAGACTVLGKLSDLVPARWCEIRPDRLALIDAKTGPRHVLLGEAARALLDGFADRASGDWVFPSGIGDGPLTKGSLYWFWIKARNMAGIVADARLHDLRHAHPSHAVMNGESLHITGRLLGHRRASTTNRYVHLDDASLSPLQGCRCP